MATSAMQIPGRNGDNGVYKFLTTVLITIVISMGTFYFAVGKDAITKQDMPGLLATMQRQIDDQTAEIAKLRSEVVQLEIDTARISDKLGVPAHPAAAER